MAAESGMVRRIATMVLVATSLPAPEAHHSLAMYRLEEAYMMTGVIVRVDANPIIYSCSWRRWTERAIRCSRTQQGACRLGDRVEAAVWRP